jgi:NADH-quinone oxidoreductase subunit L
MPITAMTFIVGWLAIAGVPPFSGFWSKDEILLAAWEQPNIGPVLWGVGLVTAILTAYYMSRQVFLVFYGEARWNDPRPENVESPEHDVHPHESPWTMWVPLAVLAVAAAVGGALNLPVIGDWLVLEHFLEPVFAHPHHFESGTATKIVLAVIAVIAGIIGIAFAAHAWLRHKVAANKLEPKFLTNAMYVDATYAKVVGGPGTKGFDLAATFDNKVVDGAVNGTGRLVRKIGELIQPAQSGFVRQYAIGVAIGGIALVVWLLSGTV